MPKKTYTEEQIASALRQVEAGTPVAEICRKLGVTAPSFYRWKRRFAGRGLPSCVASSSSKRRTAASSGCTPTSRWRIAR